MATLQVEKTRTLCPPGPATFALQEVEVIQMQSFDGSGQVERLLWRFVSSKRDPEGAFYEVPVFTGYSYGNPKAKLTWLLDMLLPGITKREADNLDTETLVGRHYEGSVKHGTSERDPDKKVATFTYLRPLGAPADPFVDGDAGSVPTEPNPKVKATKPLTSPNPEPEPAGVDEVGDAVCMRKGCGEMLTLAEIQASIGQFGKKRFCRRHAEELNELSS